MKYLSFTLVLSIITSCSSKIENIKTFPISEFLKITAKPSQYFIISNDRDTIIEGKEGTIILLPKNCFNFEDDTRISKDVNIELKEFYTISDMLLNNLTTTSDKQSLETGGMIFISTKDKNVSVKDSIIIKMPNKLNIQSPSIFYGKQERDNFLNWNQDKTKRVIRLNITGISALGNDTVYQYNDKTISKNKQQINNYVMSISKLGWVNCDRFLMEKSTTQLALISNIDEKHYLILKKYNSIIPGYQNKNLTVIFKSIPTNQEASILSIKLVNDQIYYSLLDINTSKTAQLEKVQYTITTVDNLEKILKRFN